MDIKIFPLGAGKEVGRSCIIVKINDVKIMLDCGVHMGYNDERKFPEFKKLLKKYRKHEKKDTESQNDKFNKDIKETLNILNNKNTLNNFCEEEIIYYNITKSEKEDYSNIVDLVLISHFHLDHVGALPFFTEKLGYEGPILCTQPTKSILPVTLEDFRKVISEYQGKKSNLTPGDIKNCIDKIDTIKINETKLIKDKIKVTCYYAGHVLGACMFHLDINGYTLIYTGDYNTIIDRHLAGAYSPKIYPDLLISETTYGDKIRPTKRLREREFISKILETIKRGGKVLVPIFALGRAQELCILINSYWKKINNKTPIYFVGPMAEKVNFYYKLFQNWMNYHVQETFEKENVFDFKFVKQTDKVLIEENKPMVIFATPGMLHGGFSLNIFKKIAPNSKNSVIIPGYCSAGTVGNRILAGEKEIEIDGENINVNCEVFYMSFSAHADQKGLLQLIEYIEPKKLLLVHGDIEAMKKFKEVCKNKMEDTEILMPSNSEIMKFEDMPKYIKVNLSDNLFSLLHSIYNRNLKYNSKAKNSISCAFYLKSKNLLFLPKVNISNNKKMTVKNRINLQLKNKSSVDVILEIMKVKETSMFCFYNKITKNNELDHFVTNDKLIIEFQYQMHNLEEKIKLKKIQKIIYFFQGMNKVLNNII